MSARLGPALVNRHGVVVDRLSGPGGASTLTLHSSVFTAVRL
jgi:hypothetical protein